MSRDCKWCTTTADQLWPDEAREAVARALAVKHDGGSDADWEWFLDDSETVLAALSVHVRAMIEEAKK